MADPARGRAFDEIYARYLALPEGTKAEIVAGGTEIRVLPRPKPRHVRSASQLGADLVGSFGFNSHDGPGGWVILIEPELRLGDEIRAPDLAGWRVERYAEDDGPFVVAPDWICEVLSPSTARYDRSEKMPLYARHGVSHVWLLDPAEKTLEVYRREGELWLLLGTHAGDVEVRPAPFDAVALDLARLWRVPG